MTRRSVLLQNAEENDKGELVWKRKTQALAGGTKEVETNVTALLQPGMRKTGKVEHLVIEAELYAEREPEEWGGNPARPVDSETAKRAIEQIESKGLEPAWRKVDKPGDFP
jgi:hypothetical protein